MDVRSGAGTIRQSYTTGSARRPGLSVALKLLFHPTLESFHILRSPQEVPDQIVRGNRSSRCQHGLAISHGSIAREEVRFVELEEKVLGDHFVPQVSVVSRRIASQMIERSVKMCVW